jgi:transcriptional regulator with XRE-family HTH domain
VNAAAATLLRSARRSAHLTQRDLADRAGVPQPAIADVESTKRDTKVQTLGTLLRATGQRLAALPTTSRTVAETADAIYLALRRRDDDRAYREVLQLNDDLRRSSPDVRVALSVLTPPPTSSQRYDALLAALVEYHLKTGPRPSWLHEPYRSLAERWYVNDNPYLHESSIAASPKEFARRNIALAESELAAA